MPGATTKLGLPIPLGPEIHRRQVIVDLAEAIDAAVPSQAQADRPFFVSSLTYEAGPNRLALTMGAGRARFGNQLVDRAAATVYINNPAINTTYYVYILNDGTADGDILVNTTGAELANTILLWSAAVGASTAALTLTDRRADIYGTAAAQPHTHDGTVTPTVAMLNNRFITGQDSPGGVARNLVGIDAANATILGHNVAGHATRILAGSQASVEVAGINAAVFTTTLATLIGGLTLSGPITGATTVGGTLTTPAQPNVTSLGTLVSLVVSGAGSFGSISASGGITGTLNTAAQPNITSLGTLASLAVTGAISAGSFSTSGAVAGSTVTGTLSTAAQPNVTSLGTLASLTMAGNIVMAGHNITGAGTIAATTFSGTLSTAAQPNVTSLGTLVSLNVSGAIAGGSLSLTSGASMTSLTAFGSITTPTINGTLATAAQPNVTSLGTLTSVAVSGAGSFGSLSAPTITGTLATGVQPNITRVGNLDELRVANSGTTVNLLGGIFQVVGGAGINQPFAVQAWGAAGGSHTAGIFQAYNNATSAALTQASLGYGTSPLVLGSALQTYIRLVSNAPFGQQWQVGGGIGTYYGRFPISLDGLIVWVPMYS